MKLEELKKELKDLTLRLNKGEQIDWADGSQTKFHIFYNAKDNKLGDSWNCVYKNVGNIYCLNPRFLDIAKQEIGEENLKKLFE